MNVLTPAQRAFLSRFFATPAGRAFYLTGGGALAEFYLGHRLSQDLDLFTQDRAAWQNVEMDLRIAADAIGATVEFRPAKPPNELHRAFLRIPGEADLKIDIVRDAPPYFGQPQAHEDGVIVDALNNLAVGKLAALCGRGYPRDFVDVYCLLEKGMDAHELIERLKVKDPGIYNGYIAEMLRRASRLELEDLPTMLKSIDLEHMKQFFLQLADQLAAGHKPNE